MCLSHPNGDATSILQKYINLSLVLNSSVAELIETVNIKNDRTKQFYIGNII